VDAATYDALESPETSCVPVSLPSVAWIEKKHPVLAAYLGNFVTIKVVKNA